MIVHDRRLRSNEQPTRAILVVWLVVSAIMLAIASSRIMTGEYHGPDDALRMVQVRDLLAGQPWYDLHQYRMTPPDGTLMHWSRLVDLPIAGLVLFFSLFLEIPMAERAAMVATPLFVLLLTMLAVGRLAWRLFDRQIAIFACAVFIVMPVIAVQYQPMRVDHHGWQIFAIAVALWGLAWRRAAQGGAVAGVAMAFGLMISLEPIFMAAGIGVVLTWRWLRQQRDRWWLVSYLQALALSLVVLFAATRGLPDLAQHCDVISPTQMGFFVIVALGTGMLAIPAAIPRIPLIIGLGVSGLIGIAFIGWSAPQCLAPPFSNLDPLVHDFWYLSVGEGRPVWTQPIGLAVPGVLQPLLALAIVILLATRSRGWEREWWFEYALLLLVAFLSGVMTFRSMAFAGVLCAIPFAWLVTRVFARWRTYKGLLPKLGLAVVLYLVFVPSLPVIFAERLLSQNESGDTPRLNVSQCDLRQNSPLLDRLPASTLFAPLDVGPVVLFRTRHSVVASGHHRAERAMRDVIASFTGTPEFAKQQLDAYGADFVFVCTDLIEPHNYMQEGGEQAFMTRLVTGDVPDWLEPVDVGGPAQFRVWRVIRD